MKRLSLALLCLLLTQSCTDSASNGGGEGPGRRRGGPPGGGPPGAAFAFGGAPDSATAVPVEVAAVVRRDIADYIETNGALEAENEVDIVARIGGPIVELNVEEGMQVRQGEVLARIDADEIRAQLGVARVAEEEARLALERAQKSLDNALISREVFDQAQSRYDSAAAQLQGNEILLGYTDIVAPFDGLIVERAVKFAQYVATNTKLFRISDFDPLLCLIQIPEKDLSRLSRGQRAYLTVEAFPDERFPARVLRVSPVVDARTGTVKVTLEAEARGKLRPGMFASVFLEVDVHRDTLVMPKAALVLESIGDLVYVKNEDDIAERREVELGFQDADSVEVLAGIEEGEPVVVVGQDSLSDGTPVYVLSATEPPPPPAPIGRAEESRRRSLEPPRPSDAPLAGRPSAPQPRSDASPQRGGFDPREMTPERLERIKARMRQLGLSDEEIEARLEQIKNGTFRPPGRRPGGDS